MKGKRTEPFFVFQYRPFFLLQLLNPPIYTLFKYQYTLPGSALVAIIVVGNGRPQRIIVVFLCNANGETVDREASMYVRKDVANQQSPAFATFGVELLQLLKHQPHVHASRFNSFCRDSEKNPRKWETIIGHSHGIRQDSNMMTV